MSQDDRTLLDQVPPTLRSEVQSGIRGGNAPRTPTLTMASGPNPGRFAAIGIDDRTVFIGRDASCEFSIDDPSVSRRHARVYQDHSSGRGPDVVVQDLGSTNGTLVNGQQVKRALLSHGDRIHIGDVLLRFEMLDPIDIAYRDGVARKVEDSDRDPLTRLLSRAAMDAHLPDLLARCDEKGWPVSALMMDLDHFKQVNDTRGHAAGDTVLKAAAEIVRDAVRKEDLAIRFGGEEFLVVLAGARRLNARVLAERLRERIAAARFDHMPDLQVTASLGVAERGAVEPLESWIDRADKALYRAKDRGRNRSEAAPPARG